MKIFERNGTRFRLEAYANGGARATVAAFKFGPYAEPQALGSDSINLNRASERARWIATLPEAVRTEAEAMAIEVGVEIERWRASGGATGAKRAAAGPEFAVSDPWPEPVDGAALLNQIRELVTRYVVLPTHGPTIVTLWIAHTYLVDVSNFTPYLWIASPVRGCGKTTLEDLLLPLCYRACKSDGITAAALYRRIDRLAPTMLLDELDTRLRIGSDSADALRGVLDSGFQRGGKVTICVGDEHEERDFNTFCPKALAGLGRLHDTIASRSIPLVMQKASRAELAHVSKMRTERMPAICEPYRRQLQRWADDVRAGIADADPVVPDALEARQADVWRPLLAIAEAAGGDWPAAAEAAAVAMVRAVGDEGDLALLLLNDLRDLFLACGGADGDKLPSDRIAAALAKQEDRPWPEYRNAKAISPPQIARLLGRFGIKPRNLRLTSGDIVKGYRFADCLGAFERYLPQAATSATSDTERGLECGGVADVAARADGVRGVVNPDEQYELDERAGLASDA